MGMTTNPLSAYRKIAPGKVVTKPAPSYQPQSSSKFEDWYKQNYGAEYGGEFSFVKPEGMDYNTWQTGQTLYNLYNTEKQAGEAYGQRIGAIDKQADYQNQQAYILAQKLQKYLGLTAAAQGQKGIAAGDLIAAQTDYQNRLAGIASAAEGYRQEAYDTKQNAITAAKSGTQERLAQLYAQQESSGTADQEQWYATVLGTIENKLGPMQIANEDTGAYSYEDWQSLWKIYEDNKGKMSKSQQQMMEFYLKNIDHEEEVAEDEIGVGKKSLDGKYVVSSGESKKANQATQKKYKNGDFVANMGNTGGIGWIYFDGYLYPAKKA